jgi:hypothetical protein
VWIHELITISWFVLHTKLMCPKECIWETSNQQPKAMYGNFNCCGTTNDQHSWQSITVCKNSYLKDCIDRLIDREENQKPFQTGPNSMVLGRILLQSNMENPMLPKKNASTYGKIIERPHWPEVSMNTGGSSPTMVTISLTWTSMEIYISPSFSPPTISRNHE